MKYFSILLSIFLLASCTYKEIQIDPSEFNKLPEVNYNDVTPSFDVTCWQLFYSLILSPDSIVYSTCSQDNSASQRQSHGFYTGCKPLICFHFIKTIDIDKVTYWTTPDSLRKFLYPIENISEAQFLCNGFDYYSTDQSVYKLTEDGYLITMFKLVSTGMPIQTDKFLLLVTRKGKIKIIGREIARKIDNAIRNFGSTFRQVAKSVRGL